MGEPKGKGKGKELLLRYQGEVVDGEDVPVVTDPRKVEGFKRVQGHRVSRNELYAVQYEVSSYFNISSSVGVF